jgi:PTS system N-acetylgalactosamine-specific IIA component
MSDAICRTMTSSVSAAAAVAEPTAVVAGHGTFAAGIVSAVQQITGLGARFTPVSNSGYDAAALESAVRAAVTASGASVIFTDLPAGSCTIAARRVARGDPALAVVTGVNLALLLEFAMKGACDAASIANNVEKGRASILVAQVPEIARVD